jgi:hypothetical protein
MAEDQLKLVRLYSSQDGKLWVYVDGVALQVGGGAVMIGDVIDGNDASYIFDGGIY